MTDLKIFVSTRIDIDSAVPSSPLYVPVRCGAVNDKNKASDIQGDDCGDNISDKRLSYGEFTVQYWAWRNTCSDYVGLCHYRRYFSLSNKKFRAKKYDGMVHVAAIDKNAIRKFELDNTDKLTKIAKEYDIVIPQTVEVKRLPTKSGIKKTVGEMWDAYTEFVLGEDKFSEIIIKYIEKTAPKYLEAARSYLDGSRHHGFNCYIMRRELFNEMCEMQFPIMKKFEDDCASIGVTPPGRTAGYLGEALNGIFIHYLISEQKASYRELQLVFFHDTEISKKLAAGKYLKFYIGSLFDLLLSLFFPRGSKRRRLLKSFFKKQ